MLQTFKPASNLLQRHIDCFYVFNSDKPENISYIAFPHVNTAISFFKGVDIYRDNYSVNITPAHQHKSKCSVEILGKYTQPVL